MSIDLDKLQQEFADILKPALEQLLEGAEEDLNAYLLEISRSALEAAQVGDDERLKELVAQLKALGEVHRLRAVDIVWGTIDSIVLVASETALMLFQELLNENIKTDEAPVL